VCRPKDQGGLEIHDVEVKNRALTDIWILKVLTEDGFMVSPPYIGSSALSQVYWKLEN
jgi:hypothetical protein